MRTTRKTAAMVAGVLALLPVLAACQNTQTTAAECAYVIDHNYFDAKHIKDFVLPGNRVNTNNTTVDYVPCNARNFIITTRPGDFDRHEPVQAKTRVGEKAPAMPINIQLTAYFQLNQHNRDAMYDFLAFCQKYSCFGSQDEISHSSTFASAGFKALLRENMSFAIDRATQQAALTFGPDLWTNRADWPKLADMVAADFASQLRTSTGSKFDYFCASGAGTDCKPVRFSVEDISPSDNRVRELYDQQVLVGNQKALSDAQRSANDAALSAAKAKYGAGAGAILGQLDVIQACKASGGQCVVNVGGANVTVPVK